MTGNETSKGVNMIIRTGFLKITHAIKFNPEGERKGKELAKFNVRRVEELISPDKTALIRCSVIRTTNVNLPPYKVQLEIDVNRHVNYSSCTCVSKAGQRCKHIASLITYINNDTSSTKTSYEAEWGKPSDSQLGKELYAKPIIVGDVYTSTRGFQKAKIVPYELQYSDVANINCPLRPILKHQAESHLTTTVRRFVDDLIDFALLKIHIMNCDVSAQNLINFSHNDIIYSLEIDICEESVRNFYDKNIVLSDDDIVKLCVRTINQSECNEWFVARRLRISASNKAHAIKTLSKKDCSKLVDNFLHTGLKDKRVKSLEYGKKNEKKAIGDYATAYNVQVIMIGLFVMPLQPWLCCSVDGLVLEDFQITKVLEIKCPYSCSSKAVFEESTKTFNVPYLHMYNGNACLKESHQYYTQCQIQMYVTGLTECALYVWSPKGSSLVTVVRNEFFLENVIPKLKYFYFNFYLKGLKDNEEKENT